MEATNSNRDKEGNDNQSVTADVNKPLKGKSCKGCLFYSSVLNSKSQSPFCVGFSRTLQQVPDYVANTDSKVLKGNQTLTDFRYACVGYSVHHEKNFRSTEPEKRLGELPFCVGLEFISSKRASNSDQVPASFHKEKDGLTSPQPRPPIEAPSNGFLHRFARSAGVVATGVKRNILRVANRIKEKMDNALDPYRRRSK